VKGLTEITLLDSTHNLGLRCKLERDLLRVVERLSADTGEATRKETVNAIGLTRRIGDTDVSEVFLHWVSAPRCEPIPSPPLRRKGR
jgi:hypothetical protein